MGVQCLNMSLKMPELEKTCQYKLVLSFLSDGSSLIQRRTVVVAVDFHKVNLFFPSESFHGKPV